MGFPFSACLQIKSTEDSSSTAPYNTLVTEQSHVSRAGSPSAVRLSHRTNSQLPGSYVSMTSFIGVETMKKGCLPAKSFNVLPYFLSTTICGTSSYLGNCQGPRLPTRYPSGQPGKALRPVHGFPFGRNTPFCRLSKLTCGLRVMNASFSFWPRRPKQIRVHIPIAQSHPQTA
jgi:hypothetical protein